MKYVLAMLCGFSIALSAPVLAQEKKQPSEAQKKQQARMKDCNEKAGDKKGDERKAYMSSCLKGQPEKGAMTPQQSRMKDCNKQASDKKMKGDERKAFMSSCLKG